MPILNDVGSARHRFLKKFLNHYLGCTTDGDTCRQSIDSPSSTAANLSPNKLQICIPSGYKATIFNKSARIFLDLLILIHTFALSNQPLSFKLYRLHGCILPTCQMTMNLIKTTHFNQPNYKPDRISNILTLYKLFTIIGATFEKSL